MKKPWFFIMEVNKLIGLVTNVQKGLINVYIEEELKEIKCILRGKLFNQLQKTKSLVVVGDYVEFEKTQGNKGVIKEIKSRKTKLVRRGAGKKGKHMEQILASNIDQALLVFSVKDPSYKTNLIDRYIIAAKHGGIEPIIIFNKIDLVDKKLIEEDIKLYRENNYKVFITSTFTGEGIEEVKKILNNKISVFTGISGVGKSSLVNSILNDNLAKTGEISSSLYKGKHTTTSSSVYFIPQGGKIIDIPGLREFGIISDKHEIEETFKDIFEISKRCKFRNCSHTKEPECAVKIAVEEGKISEKRYRNFIKLKQDC
ncbi:MAG: ribosome biosis GTPase / thiamine phosphate phosphatase [Kosmotogales bacterium]|nr:ribosome biosis GTPase / thiamine phosphate phosphatase [Kosmotogales bacterium]